MTHALSFTYKRKFTLTYRRYTIQTNNMTTNQQVGAFRGQKKVGDTIDRYSSEENR